MWSTLKTQHLIKFAAAQDKEKAGHLQSTAMRLSLATKSREKLVALARLCQKPRHECTPYKILE